MQRPIPSEPTDRLILHTILWHAGAGGTGPKAFLSGNRSDFDQEPVLQALAEVGVRYFSKSSAAVGWLASQAQADDAG